MIIGKGMGWETPCAAAIYNQIQQENTKGSNFHKLLLNTL